MVTRRIICWLKKMIDIFSLSVEEMASKIKEGQLTSVEVCEKYIERVNKFEKDVKAWVHFDKKILFKVSSVQVQKISNQFKTEVKPKENQAEVS